MLIRTLFLWNHVRYDSIFDVIGHIMVGPSSSHTAGACRIGYIAQKIFDKTPEKVKIWLHGSFAETYQGHGTDVAVVAGLLGLSPEDERIPKSFELSKEASMEYIFDFKDLGADYHPNSVLLELESGKEKLSVLGSSIGGGNIIIEEIDGLEAGFSGDNPTLICVIKDVVGVIAKITQVISTFKLNIGTMRVSRHIKKKIALCWLEMTTPIPAEIHSILNSIPEVQRVRILNP
jgi:L-serine dehydratase